MRQVGYRPLRKGLRGVKEMDDAVSYHELKYDRAEPDPYPEAGEARRRLFENLDIRAAVTVYKETEE